MKKIISLTLVLALALSMALSVSAADGTITLAELTTDDLIAADDYNPNGYYEFPIEVSGLYARGAVGDSGEFKGYNTASMYVLYDSTKLQAGYMVDEYVEDTEYGSYNVVMDQANPSTGKKQNQAAKKSTFAYQDNAYDSTHRVLSIVMKDATTAVLDGGVAASGVLTNIYFRPVDGASGVAEISVLNNSTYGLAFGIKGGITVGGAAVTKHSDFTLNPGSIDLGTPATTKYTVTASAGANGSIAEKDGKTEGATGDVLTYNITADTGYVIDTITVDGVADTSKAGQAAAEITYTVAEANGAISVTFKAKETKTTIAQIKRYKATDDEALYVIGKVVEGTDKLQTWGVAVNSVKRGTEVYYYNDAKTAEGYYAIGLNGTAYDNTAGTRCFADTEKNGRIFSSDTQVIDLD